MTIPVGILRNLVLTSDLMTYLSHEHAERFYFFRIGLVHRCVRGGWFRGSLSSLFGLSGLSSLFRSLNQTNQTNQTDQMDQIPATRREMFDCKTWHSFFEKIHEGGARRLYA